MTAPRAPLLLLAVLAVWMGVTWPNLDEQLSTTRQTWDTLGGLSWEERNALEWPAGYRAVQEIARSVPPAACVQILARTSPDRLQYYQARFPYHLYPRRLRFGDGGGTCEYLALFRDDAGTWDEPRVRERAASRTRIFAGERVEIYR